MAHGLLGHGLLSHRLLVHSLGKIVHGLILLEGSRWRGSLARNRDRGGNLRLLRSGGILDVGERGGRRGREEAVRISVLLRRLRVDRMIRRRVLGQRRWRWFVCGVGLWWWIAAASDSVHAVGEPRMSIRRHDGSGRSRSQKQTMRRDQSINQSSKYANKGTLYDLDRSNLGSRPSLLTDDQRRVDTRMWRRCMEWKTCGLPGLVVYSEEREGRGCGRACGAVRCGQTIFHSSSGKREGLFFVSLCWEGKQASVNARATFVPQPRGYCTIIAKDCWLAWGQTGPDGLIGYLSWVPRCLPTIKVAVADAYR